MFVGPTMGYAYYLPSLFYLYLFITLMYITNTETTAISSVISSSAVQPPSVEQAPGSSIVHPLVVAPQTVGGSEISPYFAPNSAISEANVRLVYYLIFNDDYFI